MVDVSLHDVQGAVWAVLAGTIGVCHVASRVQAHWPAGKRLLWYAGCVGLLVSLHQLRDPGWRAGEGLNQALAHVGRHASAGVDST